MSRRHARNGWTLRISPAIATAAILATGCNDKRDGAAVLQEFRNFVVRTFGDHQPDIHCEFRVDVRHTDALNEPWQGMLHADIRMLRDGQPSKYGWTLDAEFDRDASRWTCSKIRSQSADPTMDACETLYKFCEAPSSPPAQAAERDHTPAGTTGAAAVATSNVHVLTQAQCSTSDAMSGAATCHFSVNGMSWRIDEQGHGTSSAGGVTHNFALPLDDADFESAQFAPYEDGIILVYDEATAEGGGGVIARLRNGAAAPMWRLPVGSFNVSDGVIENNRLFIAASKIIASVDLDTGRFAWRHDDVKYNAFQRPEVHGDEVVFRESPDIANAPVRLVRVRKADGTVVQAR